MKEEKLQEYFSKDIENREKYEDIAKDFIEIKEDLFIKKVYPDLYTDCENCTFLGASYENKIFTFYFLSENMLVAKSLYGGNTEEDYKRYQEQLMELGRS